MLRRVAVMACALAWVTAQCARSGQTAPLPSSARILLLPKRIVTGEKATLAVLDVTGRLTPGVKVELSTGDHLVTDATGRAQFTAPVNPGVIYATIGTRPERVYTTILTHGEAPASPVQVAFAPRFASLADRFELSGSGFCGQADANQVRVSGKPAMVLASSPAYMIVMPPENLAPGSARVDVSCAQGSIAFTLTFLELSLEADSSPLSPGVHRALTVRVRGTDSKVPLEARNLAPRVASLAGGNGLDVSSSGGTDNQARFDVVGRERGNFIVSIRLATEMFPIGSSTSQ